MEIGEEHTRVFVPQELVEQIVNALKKTTLRGRKFAVDLDRTGED
jgi:hypothetical protein